MVRNIVQLNNRYIQDENQHRRYLEQEKSYCLFYQHLIWFKVIKIY